MFCTEAKTPRGQDTRTYEDLWKIYAEDKTRRIQNTIKRDTLLTRPHMQANKRTTHTDGKTPLDKTSLCITSWGENTITVRQPRVYHNMTKKHPCIIPDEDLRYALIQYTLWIRHYNRRYHMEKYPITRLRKWCPPRARRLGKKTPRERGT